MTTASYEVWEHYYWLANQRRSQEAHGRIYAFVRSFIIENGFLPSYRAIQRAVRTHWKTVKKFYQDLKTKLLLKSLLPGVKEINKLKSGESFFSNLSDAGDHNTYRRVIKKESIPIDLEHTRYIDLQKDLEQGEQESIPIELDLNSNMIACVTQKNIEKFEEAYRISTEQTLLASRKKQEEEWKLKWKEEFLKRVWQDHLFWNTKEEIESKRVRLPVIEQMRSLDRFIRSLEEKDMMTAEEIRSTSYSRIECKLKGLGWSWLTPQAAINKVEQGQLVDANPPPDILRQKVATSETANRNWCREHSPIAVEQLGLRVHEKMTAYQQLSAEARELEESGVTGPALAKALYDRYKKLFKESGPFSISDQVKIAALLDNSVPATKKPRSTKHLDALGESDEQWFARNARNIPF